MNDEALRLIFPVSYKGGGVPKSKAGALAR